MGNRALDKYARRIELRTWRIHAARIKKTVSIDLEKVAMKLIGAGLELVGGNAVGKSVLCGKIIGDDVGFVDQFVGRIVNRLKALGFGLSDYHAIEHDLILEVDAAVDPMTECATGNTGSEKQETVNLAITSAAN